MRPSRPEQSFSQQTEDLGGSSSDRDSVSARRSQGKQSINYKTADQVGNTSFITQTENLGGSSSDRDSVSLRMSQGKKSIN